MYSKCMPVFVKDMAAGIASYEALGLKCTGQHENKDGGMIQSIFPLAGGGIIELIAPLDDSDSENAIVQALATRGEGMNHLSLDGSAGAVDALNAAGVRTICTRNPPLITRDRSSPDSLCADEDPTHTWIHPKTTKVLLQLNPVGMGTDEQVDLGGGPSPSL